MTRLVFLLALLPFLLAGAPTIKNALRNQVVIDFKNVIVPIVSKQIENLVLPDVHTKSGGVKVDVTKIHAHITPIQPKQISIVFVPNSSIIRISGSGFSLSGGAHIHAKWFIISKSMDASVSARNIGFAVQVTILTNGGKPNIAVNSISISLSAGNVSIKFSGGLINKILQFVANLLKGHFIKSIVSQLQAKMPPKITEVVNTKLNTLPSDIAITPTLSIKYGFPSAPYVKQDYLFTGIAGYVHPKNNP
ncbi:MAG: hypothetical protein P4M11_07125, partial [Candidatus Pacebacteria bacterium]|nr:hypothetical protein [Candidatus Paceibacterota bacterium]